MPLAHTPCFSQAAHTPAARDRSWSPTRQTRQRRCADPRRRAYAGLRQWWSTEAAEVALGAAQPDGQCGVPPVPRQTQMARASLWSQGSQWTSLGHIRTQRGWGASVGMRTPPKASPWLPAGFCPAAGGCPPHDDAMHTATRALPVHVLASWQKRLSSVVCGVVRGGRSVKP
jgi:hypothetical protein